MYPGSGFSAGLSSTVIVSPTRISDKLFMLAAMYPTSPAVKLSAGEYEPGSKYPTSVTVNVLPDAINLILSPTFTVPFFILQYAIAPW